MVKNGNRIKKLTMTGDPLTLRCKGRYRSETQLELIRIAYLVTFFFFLLFTPFSGQSCIFSPFKMTFGKSNLIFGYFRRTYKNLCPTCIFQFSGLYVLRFLASLTHRSERHTRVTLVSLGTDEPECQPACIVIWGQSMIGGPDTQRPFSASFPPTSGLHDHSYQHTDSLS